MKKKYEQLTLFGFGEPVSETVPPLEKKVLNSITVYTDGACSGNPGPGGCAALLMTGKHTKELSRGYRRTTNNRMEMMAVIMALEAINNQSEITIHSDSKYVIHTIERGWLTRWKRTGWRTKNKKPVKNRDLWEQLDSLLAMHHVKLLWVPGHAGHAENERCDTLAVQAKTGSQLLVDHFFEEKIYK